MHALTRLVAVGLVVASASAVQAQVRVQPSANTAPSAAARAATAGPNPAGLTSNFPAGITSGSGALVSRDPNAAAAAGAAGIGASNGTGAGMTGSTNVPAELLPADAGAAAAPTTVLGGAGSTVRGPGQRTAGGAGGFTAVDSARSFFLADANHDGELTRSEAARLGIATMSFEEMDRNFDGVISRFEYDDSLR
jgi:hypothetical protein